LVVENTAAGLIVRTRDGRVRFGIIEVFADLIMSVVANHFHIQGCEKHTPRVSIDRVVVSREAWSFHPGELEFAREEGGAGRFLSARRWARAHAMPRFVFVKAPVEKKPFYVDFDSPVYVDLFAKAVRRTSRERLADDRITVTEMLPRPEEAWLPDGEQQ